MMHESIVNKHERTVWAAYVLGHHVMFLRLWQESLWSARLQAAERRFEVGTAVPAEAHEVAEAVELLAGQALLDAECAVRLARSIERWNQEAEEVLRELRQPWRQDSELDWDEEIATGAGEWRQLLNASHRALVERDQHLDQWRQLGEQLAELRYEWDLELLKIRPPATKKSQKIKLRTGYF